MTVALQVFLLVGGLAVALVASDRAVAHTRSLAAALGAPPFIVGVALVSIGIVGFGATVAVRALVRLAELVGVPEFAIAFFGASLGTSAPEVMVDVTALLRGAPGIALGDAVGSSLVDSTLSIGVGPIVAPAEVTPSLAVPATVYSLIAVGLVASLLAGRRRHDRLSAFVLLALYALSYAVVIQTA